MGKCIFFGCYAFSSLCTVKAAFSDMCSFSPHTFNIKKEKRNNQAVQQG